MQQQQGGNSVIGLKRVLSGPSFVGDNKIIPYLDKTQSGHVLKLEIFSHYVARQMGFEDASKVPELCRLAQDYLRKSEGCEETIYQYLANENDPKSLYAKLIEEFDRCILSYFAFHWNQASYLISQVLSTESQRKRMLKNIFLAATREQRFEIVTKKLKVARVFSTLVEEIKAINSDFQGSETSPRLLFMGGGMGAGKSTVLKNILKESIWSEVASNVVVIEADAFKVHQSSTNAASSLLVTALNEGRDVIMDGTLSWEPFVQQTIAMARNVHKYKYRMGTGYKVDKDGTITENYWEQVEAHTRKPYIIDLVGVVCDSYLAVVRGIRRAIITRRAVRVNSQLESHKRFANSFPRYCKLVDNARLYCTNVISGPPKIIEWKNDGRNLPVDHRVIKCLNMIGSMNTEADSIYELYKEHVLVIKPGSIWIDIVHSPSRSNDQEELRESIQKIEKSIRRR